MIALRYMGDGDFKALRPKQADAEYVVGQAYNMDEIKARSSASHNFYFAAVHNAWANLNEADAERFPNEESLRKYALIKCGYADQRQLVASSRAEAQRLASFIRPMDEYAIVAVNEAVVTVYTAQSQSMRAMGKAEFEKSKTAVLDYLAAMIGVAPDQLKREAA